MSSRNASLAMKYSPSFQRLLEYAAYDCASRGLAELEVDHLTLALFREDFPLIDEVFATFRVDSLVLLDRLLRANPETGVPARIDEVSLTPAALEAIAEAEREAEALGHALLVPAHALLGVLAYHRDRLERYFIRADIVRRKEGEVLGRVRELVRWLRFAAEGGAPADRELEVIDRDTVFGVEAVRLGEAVRIGALSRAADGQKGYAVQLRMLKRFHAADAPPPRRR